MRVLDVCSGIGMGALGLTWAGMEIVAFCENDKKCQSILRKRFPGRIIFDDFKKLDYEEIKKLYPIDLICGGIPCQPCSVAGKRKGAQDNRWLWPEYFELIQAIRPNWVIVENVVGIINLEIRNIYSDLESCGYEFQTFDLSSDSLGLPTMERHIWIIATPNKIGLKRKRIQPFPDFKALPRKLSRSNPRNRRGWDLSQSRVCRVGERYPGRMDRLEQLGNSFPPAMIEVFGRAIMEIEANL